MASKKDPLGSNPLTKGIFSRTEPISQKDTFQQEEIINQNTEYSNKGGRFEKQQTATSNQKPYSGLQQPETRSQETEYSNHKQQTSKDSTQFKKQQTVTINQKPYSGLQQPETRSQDTEYSLLLEDEKDKITLQIATDINDWLDGLVRSSKRKHGRKIEKQVWTQAALQLLRYLPVDLEAIDTPERLESELKNLVYGLQNMEAINHKP